MYMASVSAKIAYPIIITGLFIIVVFASIYYEKLDANFYIILIPLTAFLFLFGFSIGQKFAFPVKKLLKEADYLNKRNPRGGFYLEDKDELGELAKVFNRIAEELEDNRSKVETLDTNVRLRTKALEEIINVLEQKIKNRTIEFQKAVEDMEKLQNKLKAKDQEILILKSQLNRKKPSKKKV
jgi:nitrate/nitrite-specific signal transduction histidine kinase